MSYTSYRSPAAAPAGERIVLENMERTLTAIPPRTWDSITIAENTVLKTGDLLIDRYGRMIYKNGRPLHLTPTEYAVIVYLVENVTIYCSREKLRELISIRFRHNIADNTLSKHIHRTRLKLGQSDESPYVVTQNSRGYKWNMPVDKRYMDRRP